MPTKVAMAILAAMVAGLAGAFRVPHALCADRLNGKGHIAGAVARRIAAVFSLIAQAGFLPSRVC